MAEYSRSTQAEEEGEHDQKQKQDVHCPKCGHQFPNPFRDPHSDPNAPQYAEKNRFGGTSVGPSTGVRGDKKVHDESTGA